MMAFAKVTDQFIKSVILPTVEIGYLFFVILPFFFRGIVIHSFEELSSQPTVVEHTTWWKPALEHGLTDGRKYLLEAILM